MAWSRGCKTAKEMQLNDVIKNHIDTSFNMRTGNTKVSQNLNKTHHVHNFKDSSQNIKNTDD